MTNSKIFETSRNGYLNFGGHYAAGTFLDNNVQATNYTKIALVPTIKTIATWSKLYQQFNLGEAYTDEQYWRDASKYLLDVTQAQEWLEQLFKNQFKITAVGAEFLEGVGNRSSEHSVQLTEAVDAQNNCYYILQSGFPALEAKSNAMKQASDVAYDRDIFSIDAEKNVSYDGRNLDLLIVAMIKDYFDREISLKELGAKMPGFRVCGTFNDYGRPATTGNRLCTVIKTTHKNELSLDTDAVLLAKLKKDEDLFSGVARTDIWKANEKKRLEWLLTGQKLTQG